MNNSKTKMVIALSLVAGVVLGVLLTIFLKPDSSAGVTASDEKKPLYWVAPMDPNYRRDGPGKSPMGMDLIPVYEEGEKANDEGPGTINIAPEVVNNLGVRTGVVERRTLHSEIVTVGYVQYDEDRLIHIHPRVSGWVEKLYVKAAGDPVRKGAPLYALYSPELVNAQEEILLAMNRNNTPLIKASEDRLRALQIPQAFIDEIKRTKKIQQTVTFHSPQDGVVDNLNIREGFYVQPGTTLFSIGALDQVWVEAEIFERQASLVKVQDAVTMTLDYLPGKTWQGKVDYIYPVLDKKTRTVRVRLRFDNKHFQLKPNMFAQVTIHSNSDETALVIPREALIRTGKQNRVVLALGEGSFKSVAVKAGRQDRQSIEVLEGLQEGEKVVISAQFLLDSESSKSSDFMRMQAIELEAETAWVAGEILEVLEERTVRARHDAIEAFSWPEMMMDFPVNDSVNFEALTPGTELHMEITRFADGRYEISATHIMSHGSMKEMEED